MEPVTGRQPYTSLDELTYPLYVPHRGGANVFPENTIDALRGSVELGFALVEFDAYLLRDGGLMVMHDHTTDRTSNLHGNAADHTTPSVVRGRIDARSSFCHTWPPDLLIPAFTDVLRRFGNHINIMVEAKNAGSGRAIVDDVLRDELGHTVILQSFLREELDPALAHGVAALLLDPAGDVEHAQLRADGVAYVGVRSDAPPENIKAARAAGLTVFAYGVQRRHARDRLLAAGVQGFISDDPLYLSGRPAPYPADPYTAQTYWHGCLASEAGERGSFTGPSEWGYTGVEAGYYGTLQGWGCPLSGDRYTIALDVAFDAEDGSGSGWAGMLFGVDDDWQWNDEPRGESLSIGGYQMLLRVDGSLELHRVDDGEATLLHAAATPSLGVGGRARVAVTVAPEGLTVSRTDTGDSYTITEGTHRGGYWHLGRRRTAVRFSHVTVS